MTSDQTPDEIFGQRLRIERERLKLSQQDAATRLGVSRAAQSNYEHGFRSPPTKYIRNLLALSFDLDFLLTGQRRSEAQVDWDLLTRSLEVAERFLLDRLEKTYSQEQKVFLARKIYDACLRCEYSSPDQVDVPDLLTQPDRAGAKR